MFPCFPPRRSSRCFKKRDLPFFFFSFFISPFCFTKYPKTPFKDQERATKSGCLLFLNLVLFLIGWPQWPLSFRFIFPPIAHIRPQTTKLLICNSTNELSAHCSFDPSQEHPFYGLKTLEALLGSAKKKDRREISMACETLKDLFITNLLPGRKLVYVLTSLLSLSLSSLPLSLLFLSLFSSLSLSLLFSYAHKHLLVWGDLYGSVEEFVRAECVSVSEQEERSCVYIERAERDG